MGKSNNHLNGSMALFHSHINTLLVHNGKTPRVPYIAWQPLIYPFFSCHLADNVTDSFPLDNKMDPLLLCIQNAQTTLTFTLGPNICSFKLIVFFFFWKLEKVCFAYLHSFRCKDTPRHKRLICITSIIEWGRGLHIFGQHHDRSVELSMLFIDVQWIKCLVWQGSWENTSAEWQTEDICSGWFGDVWTVTLWSPFSSLIN